MSSVPVILAAHNCFRFDLPVFANEVECCQLSGILHKSVGFAETFSAFKEHSRLNMPNLKRFNLVSLDGAYVRADTASFAAQKTCPLW